MGVLAQHREDIRRAVGMAIACACLLLLGAGGLVLWAATAVDRIEQAKEVALVERRVERLQAALLTDVQSATIWNDSVERLEARDLTWLQENFGDYYADYMGHEITLVHAGDGSLVLASRGSEVAAPGEVAGFMAATEPLRDAARAQAADPARRARFGFEAVGGRTGVVVADGQAWLVAASSVVREDDAVEQPSKAGVVVSARPLSGLLASMGDDLRLAGAGFRVEKPAGPAVAVSDSTGMVLGWLTWTPDRPGTAVVREAAPWLAIVLALLIGAALGLWGWMRRIGGRLAASERALTEARDRAEAASQAKSRFLSNMSHELRTPLNGVVAMGEILALGELSPIQRERLDVLRASGQDLLKMIEHLLQVTRLERGQILVEAGIYDPIGLARSVVDRHDEAARAKGLAMTLELAEVGERRGDGAHVAQVLDYLLENALTYTAKGGVRLSLEGGADRVRFEVADSGPGIPEDVLPHVFDVFTRGDDGLTSRHPGVGLGLSICRGLVEAMGGRIDVVSTPQDGTRFTVDLPAAPAETRPFDLAA
jgi:signal transduction histidine kinase